MCQGECVFVRRADPTVSVELVFGMGIFRIQTNVMAMLVLIVVFTMISKPIYLYDELGHVRSHLMLYGFFCLAGLLCVLLLWEPSVNPVVPKPHHVTL